MFTLHLLDRVSAGQCIRPKRVTDRHTVLFLMTNQVSCVLRKDGVILVKFCCYFAEKKVCCLLSKCVAVGDY